MDTSGYAYPPVDDFLKRQNAGGQGDLDPRRADGGDFNDAGDLHPKPGESDVGAGLELDRSLQQVAAHEAWLNEQSQQPVESWLQNHGGREISLDSFGGSESSSPSSFTENEENRALVIVDSRSSQWEELSRDLPENTDLLVLDKSLSGIDQVKDYLAHQSSDSTYTQISLIASSDADSVSFGSQNLDTSELSDQVDSIRDSGVIAADTVLQLFTATHIDSASVSVDVLGSANDTLNSLRGQFASFSYSSRIDSAILEAFGPEKFESVRRKLGQFITSQASPSVEWVEFDDSSVQGAYLAGDDRIFLSSSLKSSSKLERVLLEEIGHWLDDFTVDSEGDEGALFARSMLGLDTTGVRSDVYDEFQYVNVGDTYFKAEFSDITSPTIDFSNAGTYVFNDGTSIWLHSNEAFAAINSSADAVRNQFTVSVDGSNVNPSSVYSSGSTTLILNMSTAIQNSQNVTVAFARTATGGYDSSTDIADNDTGAKEYLASFTATTVTNNSVLDSTAPTLTSATVDGTAVKLNFSEALETTNHPTSATFLVESSTDGGSNWSTATYSISNSATAYTNNGSTVMLTLDAAIADETRVRVSYDQAGAGSLITDASNAENLLATVNDFNVVNATADSTAPTLTSATVDGTAVKLNFSEALETTNHPTSATFLVESSTDGGTSWSTATYSISNSAAAYTNSGSTVMLTLDAAIADETQVRVSYDQAGAGSLITDASDAENLLATVNNFNVVNGTADSTAPTLTSATVDGTAVKLNFSEALETTNHPTSATFTVESSTDGGANWATATYSISNSAAAYTNNGSTVMLTLDAAIADETQVRVSYDQAGAGSLITDASDAENLLATVNNFNVVNGTADSTAPTLTSATVDGTAVKLNFSEALETTNHPTSATFLVESSTDGGANWATATYSISNSATAYTNNGSTVMLTLDAAIADETQVRVSYDQAGAGSLITDASDAENLLATVNNFNVVNGTADSTAPTLTSATVDGTAVKLNFSEALETTNHPTSATFLVESSTDGGSNWATATYSISNSATAYTNNGSTVMLTLDAAIADETQVRVSYDQAGAGSLITDASDAENLLATVNNFNVVNGTADSTAPTLTSATVDGTAVKLNFSEALETTNHPTSATFTVESSTDGGANWATATYSISNSAAAYTNNGSTVMLTLDAAIADETQVRVSYDQAGAGSLITDASDAENLLATVNNFNVVNGTADSTAPTLTSATVDGTAVKLNFSEALETTNHPTSATFTVESSTDGGANWATATYSISNSAAAYTNNGSTVMLHPTSTSPLIRCSYMHGSTVMLTLDAAIADETQVRVSYDQAGAGSLITDASDAENLLATVNNFNVVNGTADSTAPTLTSATVDGTAVKLNFSEALETTNHPTSATFLVESSTDGGANWATATYSISNSATAYTNSGSTVMLTLDTAITDETQVRVSYDQAGAGSLITDASDAENLLATVNNFNVVNGTADSTAPTLTSATVDGTAVKLNFSEALETTNHPTSATFLVESSTDGGSNWATATYSISNSAAAYTNSGSTVMLHPTSTSPLIRCSYTQLHYSISNTLPSVMLTLDAAIADETQVRVSYDQAGAGSLITDASDAENLLATVNNFNVVNGTADSTAPTLTSATVDGTAVKLNFSEALETTNHPTSATFLVESSTDGGANWATATYSISNSAAAYTNSGSTVMLTLDTAITDESQVRVSYDQAGAGSLITDASDAENLLATVNNFNVVNGTADSTAPTLTSATVDGTAVKLNFSEALETTNHPTSATFLVESSTDGGSNWATATYSISNSATAYTNNGSTVMLTLDAAIADETQVRVSYDQAGAGSLITDASDAENLLATVNNFNVVNGTADSTAPTLTSATVDGTAVKLNFSEALETTNHPTSATFLVESSTDGGANWATATYSISNSATAYTNNGSTVMLTLDAAIADETQVRVSYDQAGAGSLITDASDAENLLATVNNFNVVNGTADSTAPTLTSATVDGTAVKLNFSEALETTNHPTSATFTVESSTDGGANWATATYSISNSAAAYTNNGSTVMLTLDAAIADETQVRVSYDQAGAGSLITDASDAENLLATVNNFNVVNGTADSTAPTLTSATVDGTAVKLNFSEALETTNHPTSATFTVESSTDGGANWATATYSISNSAAAYTNNGSTVMLHPTSTSPLIRCSTDQR